LFIVTQNADLAVAFSNQEKNTVAYMGDNHNKLTIFWQRV
jgi:hypothetical protein